jgi:hypothetical protein
MAWRRPRVNEAGNATAEGSVTARSVDRLWREKPAAPWVVAALAGVIVVVPAWMLMDDLRNFTLIGDDFAYISESRDWPTTRAHLLVPHNTHVVPIFRLWTFVLVDLAGRLESLPMAEAAASYLGLIAAMIAVGHFVAREAGQTAAGLSAMAILGISTVTHSAVTWFSAGQALWAGTATVVTVALARNWSARGGAGRFVAMVLGVILSPAIWTGGLVAGPAVLAYLFCRKPSRLRGQALLLTGLTLSALLLIVALSRSQLREIAIVWEAHNGLWPRPIQGLLHTAQALVEVCVFGNLGIDAMTTPWQAVALLTSLAVLYAWSRGGRGRLNTLEASGATIAIGSCLLAFTFRGNLPYSSLRSLGWYYAIPQIGAILFAAGWWTALTAPSPGKVSVGQVVRVLALVVIFCMIQVPRGQQQLVQGAPPFLPNEASTFPTIELRAARARYFKAESHYLQVRALARLDRVDSILSRLGASPETLRDIFGRVLIPGIHEKQVGTDALSILIPRPPNANARAALDPRLPELTDLLSPEPPPFPFWRDPNDPVSRSVRNLSAGPR